MLSFVPFVCIAFVVWTVFRYSAWLISRTLSFICGFQINVGGFCRLGVVDVRVGLRSNVCLHFDSVTIGVFPYQFSKPLVLQLGDVRIESDKLSVGATGGGRGGGMGTSGAPRRASRLALLTAQYIAVHVTRVHVVLFDWIPGCMVHCTVDELVVEGFRSRDGWQIETGCRLAQGKALRRKSAPQPSPPLVEFGLQINVSVDVMSEGLKRIAVDIKDPIFSISYGVFALSCEHGFDSLSFVESQNSPLFPSQVEKSGLSWRHLVGSATEFYFNVNNCTMRYLAPMSDGSRALSLSVRRVDLNRSGVAAEARVEGLSLTDQAARTVLRSALLHVKAQESSGIVDGKVSSDSVNTCLHISDLLWWRAHFIAVLPSSAVQSPVLPPRYASTPSNASCPSFSCAFEVESLICDVTDMDAVQSKLSLSFLTFSKSGGEVEFGVDSLTVSSRPSDGTEAEEPCFEIHHWGQTVYVGVALLQLSFSNGHVGALLGVDDCKVEWSDRLAQQIEKIFKNLGPDTAPPSPSKKNVLSVKARLKRCALLAAARQSSFLVFSSDEVVVESQQLAADFAVSARNSRLGIGDIVPGRPFVLESLRSAGKFVSRKEGSSNLSRCWNQAKKDEQLAERRRLAEEAHAKRGVTLWGLADTISLSLASCMVGQQSVSAPLLRDLLISSHGEVYLSWSPLIHRTTWHVLEESKKLLVPAVATAPSPVASIFHFKIITHHPVELDLSLPRYHRMAWRVPSLHLERTPEGFVATSSELSICCNGSRILRATNVSISKKLGDEYMKQIRNAFGQLENLANQVWTWGADSFEFTLPFEFNFAEVFSEFINCIKWIKIVHRVKKQPFTQRSPLPSDIRILIKEAKLELEDDPFETSLQANFELLEDEVYECERRRQMLTERLANVKKSNPLLPQSKIDELFDSLLEKNSAIYIERWKKQPPEKRPLFVSTWKDLKIRALADVSLHGTERCVELMQLFDPISHFPEPMAFSTLWARGAELDVGSWTVQFRDYPIPYFQASDMHFFGTLVGAEELEESGRSLREVSIPLPSPWETHTVQRNMAPLKFYYDMECEAARVDSWYGPCWEPCLSMVSLTWNNISAASLDPSPPLPFWDKMRYLLHGRFSMLCKDVRTIMLASPDPYNSTETVEWCWEEFGLDWIIGEVRIRADGLGIYVRTASKYDDSRILYLPEVRWRISLDWVCLGDPHDHHSVTPCAPQRLPHCATEHDSYRSFRSKCLDLSFFFDVDAADLQGEPKESQRSKRPHVLLYANTFRSFEFLLNTLTMSNRPVKKGKVFGSPTRTKPQLSKHFRDVKIVVNFPYFYITYWMSHSSDYGFRVTSDGLALSAFLRLVASPPNDVQNVRRRRAFAWSPQQVTAALGKTQVYVFGEGRTPSAEGGESPDALLLSLEQLQYIREHGASRDTALHRLICTDLKASWTSANRDACLVIADGVHRAHLLRSILSNDAIKILKLKTEEELRRSEHSPPGEKRDEEAAVRQRTMSDQPSSLLQRLIDEANTKLVAHCEQTTELPSDSLLGVLQSTADDVLMLNWQVDLLNSQLVLKGCERDGFLLVTAARTSLSQKVHRCVWRNSQLLGKKSWSAVLSGMQYFAPVSSSEGLNKERFRWLSREVIEEKGHDSAVDTLNHFISTGEAVGGVVQGSSQNDVSSASSVPLQRIVSRCSCEIYFCYYSENLKTDALEEVALPPMEHESSALEEDSTVDCLTLKHNMLEASSNSAQYEMVVDIVNNLVLFVDPKKKAVAEHRQRLRFECEMMNMQQMRDSIVDQQSELREIVTMVRSMERQIYYIDTLPETQRDREEAKRRDLQADMEDYKVQQLEVSDQLAIFISCYKQRQVEHLRAAAVSARVEADLQAPVARRFEVCFEDCIWKLTESDGQIGMAQLQIRNFLYTRVMRIDNSGEHLFEVGSIRATNLLPDTIYKDTLHRDERVTLLQPAIRVILRDMPPVAGICVKEHFEVNISPMVAQITHRFFDKMMVFFFPGQNIHKDENLDTNDDSSQKLSLTRRLANIRASRAGAQFERKQSTLSGRGTAGSRASDQLDDIDRMRERADRNNLFVYIKIPEVPFVVSYKGQKEKNLLDVDRFHFVFPLCEYHERSWTWLDVSLAVKQRCRRVLLQQFMKQKLLRNRLVGGGADPFEGVTEEDKKRIALGTTSTVEKKKKK